MTKRMSCLSMPSPNALVAIIAELARHEALLRLLALGRRHLAVIHADRMSCRSVLVQPLRFLHRRDVDDARALALAQDARDLLSFIASLTVRRTSKRRLGRAKPVIVMCGSRMPSWRAMSRRTSSVAVAVSARTAAVRAA